MSSGWQVSYQYRSRDGGLVSGMTNFPDSRTAKKAFAKLCRDNSSIYRATLWHYKKPVSRWITGTPFDDEIPF